MNEKNIYTKGIIMAGGKGTRLYPLSSICSKQLQPVYDKPMIYYSLTLLMASGINQICIITTPEDIHNFKKLLKDGSQWGITITYLVQRKPEGIAQAFVLAEDFIEENNVVLVLGDNIFSGGNDISRALSEFQCGALIFAYRVSEPCHYGVIDFTDDMKIKSIEEKPKIPKSNYAIPGIYFYDKSVVQIAKSLIPSSRREYEITDLNIEYLKRKKLNVKQLSRGFVWMDLGSGQSIFEASQYVQSVEKRQGLKIGCPEEAALIRGFISQHDFSSIISMMPDCQYRHYLESLIINI